MEDHDWLSFHMGLSCANSCYWWNSMFLGLKRENAREGSSLVVWKVLLCHITRLTLLPVCCTEKQWECWMTFHGNVCFDELSQKDGQHLRVRHMSTPVLEQNLSPESKSIGFKEQLTLNRQMNDPHFLSLHLLNLLPCNTRLLGCAAQEELTLTCSRAVKKAQKKTIDLISWHAINQSYIIHKNLPPDEQASWQKASTEWLMPLFTFHLALINAKSTQGCEQCLNLRRKWCWSFWYERLIDGSWEW